MTLSLLIIQTASSEIEPLTKATPGIQDLARIFHTSERDDIQRKLNDIHQNHNIPVQIRTLLDPSDIEPSILHWKSKQQTTEETPIAILALVQHALKPTVQIHYQHHNKDHNADHVSEILHRIQQEASNTTATKTAMNILIENLQKSTPLINAKAPSPTQNQNSKPLFHLPPKKDLIRHPLTPYLLLFSLLLITSLILFFSLRKKTILLPQTQWQVRLQAPYCGGNYTNES